MTSFMAQAIICLELWPYTISQVLSVFHLEESHTFVRNEGGRRLTNPPCSKNRSRYAELDYIWLR